MSDAIIGRIAPKKLNVSHGTKMVDEDILELEESDEVVELDTEPKHYKPGVDSTPPAHKPSGLELDTTPKDFDYGVQYDGDEP